MTGYNNQNHCRLILGGLMLKIDYIFGMITGASFMLAFWACTNTPDENEKSN